ncbi:P-loop containing nucleoside triphosphate hydrolase protein [Fusarium oxysporum f. sp. albedinis]|uniref:P-loop containing nucleoside triphosphate hydrolase protein n=1 Tax=Fusarium oxysporum Fo47 TaxID=660027 RepID=UPI002869B6E0|nr:P-loop containing nucleoside triphosphate hydrolase protein [Fusarium oxysporum Fo47]KAI3574977.1 P-loop containing nucleoside triphosphate hydrolase protein [Fusarium oxysporum f. sp. albedinis]QKD52274.2 P-loop containing nucleoside triphosphate hydrolase protein [Fusarium oxysporum Fo47]
MAITIILGSQWGDEGKGKLTDILAPEAKLCARAALPLASFRTHQPEMVLSTHYLKRSQRSSQLTYNSMNFIGSGVVFNVPQFFKELQDLSDKGLEAVHDRIRVSDRVHIDLQLHIAADGLEEQELGGIGPSYSCKAARSGIRLADVFNPKLFEQKLRRLADGYRKRYGDLFKYDVEEELAQFEEYRHKLRKYSVDGVSFMKSAQKSNTPILIEGANALMLDLDYGSYPLTKQYVTSSNTSLAGIIGGLTLDPTKITEIIGVVKAYTTRVGSGAFKTEDTGDLTCQGNIHWSQTSMRMLDVLDTFETIRVATAYKIDGKEIDSYPADLDILDQCEVVYKDFPGWQTPTTNAKSFEDLPKEARAYVEFIEEYVGVKVKYIGTGPDREAMIKRD